MLRFIDREQELEFLNGRYKARGFEFIVLYGRRRVGKTELVHQFVQDKPHLYFLADRRGVPRNALRLRRDMALFLKEPEIAATELDQIFGWFMDRIKGRPVIIIDEFPYLVDKDKSIPSVLQLIIDGDLKDRNLMLILCGSSVSMMERSVLGSKSPLYGRKTGHWKVLPFSFIESARFFPKNPISRSVEFYSVLGGVPFYLEKFTERKPTLDNIEEEILKRSGHLYEEIDFLLKEELREPDMYKAILEAIGSGRGRTSEISDVTQIAVNTLDPYLKVLMRLGIISKITPVTDGKRSKRSRYVISDPLFRFWFTFAEPFKSDLELGRTDRCRAVVQAQLPSFVGKAFEGICTEFLTRQFPGRWPRMGPWWGVRRVEGQRIVEEIDVVGLNDSTKEAIFAECKWKDGVDPDAILRRLEEKAGLVDWNTRTRKGLFAIFAKSFKRKVQRPDVLLYDLESLNHK